MGPDLEVILDSGPYIIQGLSRSSQFRMEFPPISYSMHCSCSFVAGCPRYRTSMTVISDGISPAKNKEPAKKFLP